MTYYLDADTTPPCKSEYVYAGLAKTISAAFARLATITEGQIGIYKSSMGDGFEGYAIKYADSDPYFEPASDEDGSSVAQCFARAE